MGYKLNYQERGNKSKDHSEGYVSLPSDPKLSGLSLTKVLSRRRTIIEKYNDPITINIVPNLIYKLVDSRMVADDGDKGARLWIDKHFELAIETSDIKRFEAIRCELKLLRSRI